MIEHVRTVGFKGFDFDEDVPRKVIYCGTNKSGKSARAGAIALALYGHIPFSTAGKRPSDILDSFGGGDVLISAVTIGGKEFGRKFSRNAKGGVSQSFQVDKKRASADNFTFLLGKSGAPRIANTAEFMIQSEAKKIGTLFDLFPNPELATPDIDIDIENAKADVSRWQKEKNGAESTVVRLTNSKQGIEIPPGNISEVQAEIKSVESKISDLEGQIKQAEIEEAKAETEKKAKEETEKEVEAARLKAIEEGRIEGEQKEKERANKEMADAKPGEIGKAEYERVERPADPAYSGMHPHNAKRVKKVMKIFPKKNHDLSLVERAEGDSIQRIIEALKDAGCGTCAALIVAKQELKKLKGAS